MQTKAEISARHPSPRSGLVQPLSMLIGIAFLLEVIGVAAILLFS
jgi:hypothetical protein